MINETINTLTNRVSSPRLKAPGPSADQLALLFASAARAADHGLLKPFRFLVIEGEQALSTLGQLYQESLSKEDPTLNDAQKERLASLPLRAPMIVVVIACCQPHDKVPALEQQFSAAAAAQNMINSAYALNIGACWRTGAVAYSSGVYKGLGLLENESIIGFLYLGTPAGAPRELRRKDREVLVSQWP